MQPLTTRDNPPRKPAHDWGMARPVDSEPAPGYYKIRLKPFCPPVAARVWLAFPLDDDGRMADRPRRLACQINGEWASVWEHWARMWPIPREEYEALMANPPADPWLPTRSQPK
jgi:hypothetical protein